MHSFIILLIVLLTCSRVLSVSLQNRTKLRIITESIEGVIDASSKVKLVFHAHTPFHLILYTTSGVPLHFKGTNISYIGNPTYYVINSVPSDQRSEASLKSLDFKVPNKIMFEIYAIGTDWLKVVWIFLVVCAMFVLIFYKRDHKISQLCLFILLLVEVYKTSEYDKIADRIIHKILF